MHKLETGASRYPTVEFVLGAVAGWIKRHRSTRGIYDDLERCSPEDVMQIAKDLGLPASDFRNLTVKAPDAASAVSEMLCALSLEPAHLSDGDPATMRDLQRTCILCEQKSLCRHELTDRTAARRFREFCPNAYTLDALLKQKEQLHRH
jgi:hypothetical protein